MICRINIKKLIDFKLKEVKTTNVNTSYGLIKRLKTTNVNTSYGMMSQFKTIKIN